MTLRLFILLAMLTVLIIVVLLSQGTIYNTIMQECKPQTIVKEVTVIATPSATLVPTLKLKK